MGVGLGGAEPVQPARLPTPSATPLTLRVVVLEDGDVLHLHRGSYGIYSAAAGAPAAAVPRALSTLELEVASIMKGGYDHFMQKEIHEQPESLLQTMRGRVALARSARRERRGCGGRLAGGGLRGGHAGPHPVPGGKTALTPHPHRLAAR